MKYKSEDLVWLDKKEFVNKLPLIVKIFYYLGVFKAVRWSKSTMERNIYKEEPNGKRPYQIHFGGNYAMLFNFRFWNPLSLIILIIMFLISFVIKGIEGINDFIDDLKEGLEIHISKHLYTKDGKRLF